MAKFTYQGSMAFLTFKSGLGVSLKTSFDLQQVCLSWNNCKTLWPLLQMRLQWSSIIWALLPFLYNTMGVPILHCDLLWICIDWCRNKSTLSNTKCSGGELGLINNDWLQDQSVYCNLTEVKHFAELALHNQGCAVVCYLHNSTVTLSILVCTKKNGYNRVLLCLMKIMSLQ